MLFTAACLCIADIQEAQAVEQKPVRQVEAGRLQLPACADSCASLCKLIQPGQGIFDPLQAIIHLGGVPTELLPQGERGRVLCVGTPDFDNLVKGLCLVCQSCLQVKQQR